MILLLLLLCLSLLSCARPCERVVVFDAAPGESVTVQTAQGTVILDTPGGTADIHPGGQVRTGLSTPEALLARYGAVLSTVPEAAATFVLYFAAGTVVLSGESRATLAQILTEVQRRGFATEVQVTGHTDQVGDEASNARLSLERAEAVRLLLWQGGLLAPFVRVTGRGEREPLVNAPGHAERVNRRVEVLVR